jgi:BlaI family penicillinase repressor
MKELTKAEEQIMHVLWEIKKGFVNDIMEKLPEPKPAYNTVSTIVRILEKKGFVGHNAFGKTHEYHPLLSKDKYTKGYLKGFVENYFSNSYQNMVSFFSKNEDLSTKDIEEIITILQKRVDSKKLKKGD